MRRDVGGVWVQGLACGWEDGKWAEEGHGGGHGGSI